MASNVTLGFGSNLAYSTDGTSYTDIAQTVDLEGPSPEVGDVNVTNNDSPSNTKEYVPGMIEPGEQEFTVVYSKTVCAALYGMFGTGVIYFWRETYPDGSKWEYKGYLKSFGTEAPTEDGAIMNTVSIKLTTKPTFTAAS